MNIYLDNAATTKISPEVLEAMMPYLTEEYGNAGSLYKMGRRAAEAIQRAREQAALLFGCTAEHVIFTSGGSEGNSTVFAGLRDRLLASGKKHLIVSAIEHDSVLKAAQALTKDGFHITYLQPMSNGHISQEQVEEAIQEDTGLVSVMFVNNETGVVNDVRGISRVCREHSILYHMDCVQAAGLYELHTDICADFATVSSHKIHGPKGVGALYVRDKTLTPLICGGSEQEFGLRGGTENVAGIVGFGCACEAAIRNLKEDTVHISTVRQRFYMTLMKELDALGVDRDTIHINGLSAITPGKVLNLRIDGVDAETLLLMLDVKGICASAGSACRSHEAEPSHVLTAMGLSRDEARSSIRVSFSKYNTLEEVKELCFDPDADFEYFTSECATHDGTLIFELELASCIVQKICTGNTYNKSKGAPKSGDTLQYVIGNFVLLNEFDGDFIPPDKPWMAERSTMLLPIKMDIKGAVK